MWWLCCNNKKAEFDNNAKKVEKELVSKKIDDEFDVKEIGTRYSSKLFKECPFNPVSFRLLTCETRVQYRREYIRRVPPRVSIVRFNH